MHKLGIHVQMSIKFVTTIKLFVALFDISSIFVNEKFL